MITLPNSVLVDCRNFTDLRSSLIQKVASANHIGFDFETEDDGRHDGLNQFCGYDPVTRKKPNGRKLVFDMRRTNVCGFSIYCDGDDTAYYFNLAHSDTTNRLEFADVEPILKAKSPEAWWIAHNAAFELTVAKNCWDFELGQNILCTMQMAVSAWGPDTYSHEDWMGIGRGGIEVLFPDLVRASITGLPNPDNMDMDAELSELVRKVLAKDSDAAHSWNGLVRSIAFGYGLKKIVANVFGHKMMTFEECLRGRAHMGQLTGDEVTSYGADDAFWAVKVFHYLTQYIMDHGGVDLLRTFYMQENPMVQMFSNIWRGGMRVNAEAISDARNLERENTAEILRNLKAEVSNLLPFPAEPNEAMVEQEKWYKSNWKKYRQNIERWALSPDSDDAFEQCYQVRSPVSNAWAAELGKPESAGPNFAHYMPVRVLLYDLIGAKLIKKQGKIQSDGEARGKIQDRVEGSAKEMIKLLGELASVDQRMKLYIQPYMLLTDQETERMYPVVKSELATRRMSAENPNGMQLAKRGPSTYIRSFFKADEDDHVIVGEDWSAVELVAIGEASGDPKFVDAYKQVPHKDLHVGTTAAVLEMEVPGLTEDQFKSFKGMTEGMAKDLPPTLRTDLKGQPIHHEKIYGYWRTEIGKGANFEYFYSGWLNRVSERLGWDMETTGEAVERFRDHFPVAEAWRLKIIEEVKENGFITLPDGHRYTRYEATRDWGHEWLHKFQVHGNDAVFGNYNRVVNFMGRKIAKRAGNQTVNARIQGFCAALAKRTALRMQEKIGHEPGIRFMLPIHDELVYSVHRDLAPDFIPLLRETMCSHDDWFKTCRLDAAPSVGLSLEPWGAKAPIGQVELMEPPAVIVGPERAGRPLDRAGIVEVIDYLFEKRASL